MPTIPLVLHQMWLDKHTDTNAAPPAKFLQPKFAPSFRAHNPEFEHRFWNMAAVKQLFDLPSLEPWRWFYYNKLEQHIEKCDFARYALLYVHGGVYVDLDFTCHQPLASLLHNRQFIWTLDRRDHSLPGFTHLRPIFNGFLASVPGHPIWPQLMNSIMYRYQPKQGMVLNTTGPVALAEFAQSMGLTVDQHPELYVNNCLILPNNALAMRDRRCQRVKPYVATAWVDGLSWEKDPKVWWNYIKVVLRRYCVLIFAVLLVLLVFWWTRSRKCEKSCQPC